MGKMLPNTILCSSLQWLYFGKGYSNRKYQGSQAPMLHTPNKTYSILRSKIAHCPWSGYFRCETAGRPIWLVTNELLCLPSSSCQCFLNALQTTVDMFPALPSGAQLSGGCGGEEKEGTDSCLTLLCYVQCASTWRASFSDHLSLQQGCQRLEEGLAAKHISL